MLRGRAGSIFQCKTDLKPLHVVIGEIKEKDSCICISQAKGLLSVNMMVLPFSGPIEDST